MSRSVLITGASSGLGEGMAREFAGLGYNLALCARRTERLDALKEELRQSHPGITVSVRALDVNDHDRVFEVFRAFRDEFSGLDRVIVNAGIGKGQPLGTGHFEANRQTAETNFVAALAQMEAAMEIFRAQNRGHLVTVSSVSAVRGMPKNITTYAGTKSGLAALSEGLRVELRKQGSAIRVTTLYPGYIRTELNEKVRNTPFIVDAETGCRAMVRAIESERAKAYVPAWPWLPISFLMKRLPEGLLARLV
ncbi:MAG: SDR family oxidoreductase [Marinobacter sp.]|uniref:SDR family oxidoreductase n=1 Tax=Marinobacter sp. TaxID=50741 RepID=UPI00299EADFB|nr:SDR family oxidoreductase [Marinobacter sp.]MDX1634314.1 SDR family oxidoreductase [Marinobacter sp.]